MAFCACFCSASVRVCHCVRAASLWSSGRAWSSCSRLNAWCVDGAGARNVWRSQLRPMHKLVITRRRFNKRVCLRFIDYGVRNVAQGASCDISIRAGPSKMAGESMARNTRSVLPAL